MNHRLRRLEQRAGDDGCPACRDRRGCHVLVNARRLPDGTLTYPDGAKPQPCDPCGEIPEAITTIIMHVVKTREDMARQAAADLFRPT
jgi:hypothetical protein